MVLIDTNVLAYLLIDSEFTATSQRLRRRDPDSRSEAFILIEFTNVLALQIAVRSITIEAAQSLLTKATTVLSNRLAQVAHNDVLAMASRFGVTAYDARFLVLAHQSGLRLVTEDAKLRNAAPGLTQSIEEALARF